MVFEGNGVDKSEIDKLQKEANEIQVKLYRAWHAYDMDVVAEARKKYLGNWVLDNYGRTIKVKDITNVSHYDNIDGYDLFVEGYCLELDRVLTMYLSIVKVIPTAEIKKTLENKKAAIDRMLKMLKD